MESLEVKQHWENIYTTKTENEFSWFQEYPKTSVEFLLLFHLPFTANIIDIGGGDSHFVDALIELGYQHIYVLDISAKAIDRAKERLGERASKVNWIVADVTIFTTDIQFDLWHDRAAFHFLTTKKAIGKYVHKAEQSIASKGFLVLGTFSENGPEKCSGLDIKQYSEASMSKRFEQHFERIKCVEENHTTPLNAMQHFLFCSFQKKYGDE